MTTMKIEGAKELQAALLSLPNKASKKFMSKALRAGAEPVLAAAKSNAPVKTGALRDNLEIVMSSANGESAAIVQTGQGSTAVQKALKAVGRAAGRMAGGGNQGYRTAAGKEAWKRARKAAEAQLEARGIHKKGAQGWQGQYYGGILEHGFKHGKTYVKPNPWMETALSSQQGPAVEAIAASLKTNIEAEAFKE